MLDLSAEGSGLAQARARVRESMQPRLNFEGWKLGEDKAAADAARSAGKILDLGDAELRALAANLAAYGNQRCAHSTLSPHISAEAEAVAVAWFERQYARLLTELIQDQTDFWGVAHARAAAECKSECASHAVTGAHAKELRDAGLCIIDDALSPEQVLEARRELEQMHATGRLSSDDLQKRSSVRNDLVGWLETDAMSASRALLPVVDLLRGVPHEVERHTGWPLAVPHLVQAALYNGSVDDPSFYHRHLDCSDRQANPRRLTAILYLNPGWDITRYGGALRTFPCDGDPRDIAPLGGRLVLFDSCEVAHEVLPAFAPRMAITLWAFARGPNSDA